MANIRPLVVPGAAFLDPVTKDIALPWRTLLSDLADLVCFGTGSPQGVLKANIGKIYLRRDGGAGTTIYIKESGNGTNTGWVGK